MAKSRRKSGLLKTKCGLEKRTGIVVVPFSILSVIVTLSAFCDLTAAGQIHQVSSYDDHHQSLNQFSHHNVENNLDFVGPHPDPKHNPEDTENIYNLDTIHEINEEPRIPEYIEPEIHREYHDETINDNTLPGDLSNHEFTELAGGVYTGEKVLRLSESPYVLNTDLEVEEGGKLIIEPGVVIQFAPMVGITIRGTIIAVGNPMRRIVFKSQPNSVYDDGVLFDPEKLGARLVDGPTPVEGRLQLYVKGRWRSVCSNSRNWTISDYETTCRQMGFKGGRFWNWLERLQDLEPRLLFEEPTCRGTENSLFDCLWQNRQIGSGVCDYHNDIGIQCLPVLDGGSSHWRGLRFENVPSTKVLAPDNRVYEPESLSRLEYVDIVRAGSGRHRAASSAIDVIGSPPVLSHVTVDFSAYTGINVTRPSAAFKFMDVTVRRSRGYGIYVNSSHGMAHMIRTQVFESGSDGIKYIGHDLRSDERTDKSNVHDFCTFPTAAGQTYPVSLYVTQTKYLPTKKECGKDFYTRPDYLLTLNFVHFIIGHNDSGIVEVYDGNTPHDRLLGVFSIRNNTRPQSLVTTRNMMYVKYSGNARTDIVGYFRITTGRSKTYDLNITESTVADNNGKGIAILNMRSSVHVHNSSVSYNGHAAGIHVLSGAGDVNITESNISFNRGGGVNITYYGGNRNISRSAIVNNSGYGVAVWLNHTAKDREEFSFFNQTTTIEYTNVFHNLETGILHGNFCGDSWVNITGNHFNDSISHAVDIQSCWFDKQDGKYTRLQMGQNVFDHSNHIGVLISPALHIFGKIEYNTFRNGKYGALLIRNPTLIDFRPLPLRIVVQFNNFNNNQGIYVASLGVSPYTLRSRQSILFTRNFVEQNKIQELFGLQMEEGFEGEAGEGRLNPRSRVAAPIVISSSNVDVFRNIISNPHSKYEIGSQLSDQSEIINCTYNYLGNTDEQKIFEKLFHRFNRYDLAKIEYFPYLLHNSNTGTQKISPHSQFVPLFNVGGNDRIGGEIDGQIVLAAGSYTVEKDINVRPGGKLIINPGVTLNFIPNVGMMVAGRLEAKGYRPDDILLTLKRSPIVGNDTELEEMTMYDEETEPAVEVEKEPIVPIRLLGGENEHEGRLQVYLNGKWGTVCDYNWNIINAALVCHQLGLALNPYDWQLQHSEIPNAGTTEDVIMSNVKCTEHDTDITRCRSEKYHLGQFENSCSHENDVGIRCYEGAWAGLRFGVLSERVDMQYVTIEKAGIFDYSTNTFKPALQMDFARHNLENVRIVNNLQDGLGVIYSDLYGGNVINNVKNSEFSENRGNGITIKQLGLQVMGSLIEKNRGSGINHDYVQSAVEQRELAGWFRVPNDLPDFNEEESNYRPINLNKQTESIFVNLHQIKHVITHPHQGEPIETKFEITCQPGYVIGIQLLNPIENRSTESIQIIDTQNNDPRSDVWEIARDLTVFPTTSSSYGIVLHYNSGTNAIGGVVLTFSTYPAPIQNIRNRIIKGPVPTLIVKNSKIRGNHRGLTATYYNRYLGNLGEHYLRKANESMKLVNCEISNNLREAIFIHAPFWDAVLSNMSEITIHVNSSLIMNNGRGIRQFSKDLRSSNNLFHYVLQDTTVEQNALGGMEVALPYVWQYNENFTHSVYLGNTTWMRNRNFGILISGHYAQVNVTKNVFSDNHCFQGLLGFKGMEKKLQIDNNRFFNNNGKYMVEFRADSLSEILGDVHAVFEYNDLRNNRYEKQSMQRGFLMAYVRGQIQRSRDPTCVIGFGGIQKVRIMRNLIVNNNVEYDLVAGVVSATLANILDARENWWGSDDVAYIFNRIFDFDDWNNHAEVNYQPYLLEDSVDGSISLTRNDFRSVDLENLGGRLYENMTLYNRAMPYQIKSDITVMPGSVLRIQPGVEMEFEANVGILVLGTLEARGTPSSEIVMRPIKKTNDPANRVERSMENMVMHDSIRLCRNRNCTIDDTLEEPFHEGFLEYFNHTTVQWVPICDRRFTERNAQVVCRELGFDPLKVFYGHDRRIEYHINSLTRIWTWVEPLECNGDEMRMEECPERLNGQLYGRRHECKWDSEFVFVSCQGVPEERNYWGGVRFANPEFEQNIYQDRLNVIRNRRVESVLSYARLEQPGVLHGEKSPAVQTIFKNPLISSVTITDSAHHGVNLISPTEGILLNLLTVNRALGEGINAISLTGEGRESDESSFTPLKNLDLPYSLFSMIDICDPKKVITIEERVLVYYKYDNNPVNCVKIFNSAYRVKPLGFRLLQSNLFNHSKEYGRPDAIHIFDGDLYNFTSRIITREIDTVFADSPNQKKLFRTTMPSLSLRLVASGAPAHHGFIAEIVTLPISAIGFNRDAQHNVSLSEITDTFRAAMSYYSAGEVSPILTLDQNRFINNGQQFYGNFSTCEGAVHLDVQNMHSLFFRNNLVQKNQGGLLIRADSRGSATSLRGYVHHNLFTQNKNRPALAVDGRQSSPYQEITIFNNYFTQNRAAYEHVIRLKQVVSNFTYNYVHSNTGGQIMDVSGFDKVRLPIYQSTSHNGFYDNIATDWRGRATIVAGTAGQHYVDNIFFNPDNDYEMITVNQSVFEYNLLYWNSSLELGKTKIDARMNFWHWNNSITVGGRIRDFSDDPRLIEVDYRPFHMNNLTVLDGKCPPGWTLIIDTCYIYVGAPMTFREAKEFCRSDNATLPFIRGERLHLWNYLVRQMSHARGADAVWIQDINFIEQCTSFIYRDIRIEPNCEWKRPFVCEIDPKVEINPLSWSADAGTIAMICALLLTIFILLICCCCWCRKSQVRHAQRLERRNSIRQSIRSLNSIGADGTLRRRNMNMSRSNDILSSNGNDYKKMESNGSFDSMEKAAVESEAGSYENYDPYSTKPISPNTTTSTITNNDVLGAKYNEYKNHQAAPPMKHTAQIGNRPKIYSRPAPVVEYPQSGMELAFRNEGFRDNSTTYSGGTRQNSLTTVVNEGTPIINQTEQDETGSDYYGDSSTLPIGSRGNNLSFLIELKNKLPEYETLPRPNPNQSSFLPPPPETPPQLKSQSMMSDQSNRNSMDSNGYHRPQIRKPQVKAYSVAPPPSKRPDSYYTAMKTTRDSSHPSNATHSPPNNRPKTVYEASGEDQVQPQEKRSTNYNRSKSEALLETNFDDEPLCSPLSVDNRSHSQPLETAM